MVVLPDGGGDCLLVESSHLACRDLLQARRGACLRRSRCGRACARAAHRLRTGDPCAGAAEKSRLESGRSPGQGAHFVSHEKAAHQRIVCDSGFAARRVRDRLLVCGADAAESGRDHAAGGSSAHGGTRRYADRAGRPGGSAGRAGSAGAGAAAACQRRKL